MLNPSQKSWNYIEGYSSGVDCPICTFDILVKTGLVGKVIWALCHVCFDKEWEIPTISPDQKTLVYVNKRTNETRNVNIRGS